MIEFRLLGSVDLKGWEGETLRSVLAQPKRVALLAYLAVAAPNGYHRRDKLLGLFWAERDQEHARAALRKAVYLLRQSLGEDVVVSQGDDAVALAEGAVWCDAVAFEAELERGEFEKALGLYQGDLLDGFYISDAPEFERWLEGERERLRQRAAEAAWALAEGEAKTGNGVEAAHWARRAAALAWDDEGAVRRAMEFLDRVGDRAGAVKEYEAFARRLRDEYEAEPAPETQALIAAIRERDVAVGDTPVVAPSATARAVAPWPVARAPAREREAEARPMSLPRVLATYALVSLAVLVAVHIFTLQLGLPGWFFPSAVVVLLVCLPIIVATALVQGAAVSAKPGGGDARAPSVARRWLTWRTSIGVTIAALAVLGLAVTGFMAFRVTGIGPWGTLIAKGALEKRDVIVLADFEDHTNDSLAMALKELVRVDLAQSRAIGVADDDYVSRVLERMERDPEASLSIDLAREVAIREGLKAVATGEVHRVGSSYVLSLSLVAAETGETLASFRETATDLDATIPAIEQMSRELRERIGESLKTVRASPPLRRVRTASLEALRVFTEGQRALNRGERSHALELYNRAIEIDTAFAAAYRGRATALGLMGIRRAQRIADATRAYELRHRLPLEERYRVEASYHGSVKFDREKVVSAYRALSKLEPNNARWLSSIAWESFLLRDYARAEEMYRRVLELDSLATTNLGTLARILFDQGKFDEAWETLRQFEQKHPEHQRIPLYRARFASALGDYDAARLYLKQWRDMERGSPLRQADFNRLMAHLAQVQGRLADAEDYWRRSRAFYEEADAPRRYCEAAVQLAGMRLWFLGDTTRALETVADALGKYPFDSLEPPDRSYTSLPGFYAFAGAPGRAREVLAEWDTVLPPDVFGRGWEVYRHSARGAVALAEGRPEEAMLEFRWVHEHWFCPICAFPLLGRAHELAGQSDSALAMYERYLGTAFDRRTLWGDLPDHGGEPYWLPVVYERLGDLHEQRGDTARAIHYYGKLVDLWRDADPELQPRVEAARRAIEALSPDI